MRSVGVNTNVPTTKGLAELNHHTRVELKEVRNGAGFDGRGLSDEDESRINEDVRHIGSVQMLDGLHRQHQGSLVQWERFFPSKSLKVLLVEDDDSTRHVVSALLRNCGYEVMAVANGLEAWKVLIDVSKQIDLVLTEVVMPYLSGIGLLTKIMNNVTRKNTPVIMMSSDDSMGIVFNCLSKGAVDFLVKPIRKNELKNIWQHVWRKCHSSSGSGSGSESGIRDEKATKSRSIEESDDGSDNSDEDDDVSIELNAKGGSDNGSGTQSSWPKRAVEVDSSQATSLQDKLPDGHDSAQAARPETTKNHRRSAVSRREHVTEDDKLDNIDMGKDLEIGVPKSSSFEVDDTNKKGIDNSNSKKVSDEVDIGMQIGCQNGAPKTKALGATKISNAHAEALKANHLLNNINIEDYSKESPTLELSLKRPRDVEDAEANAKERNVLRHSGLSAFSKYNTGSIINQTPTGNVGSCSPLGICSDAAKPNGTPIQRSNGSDDMGSTTNNAFSTKPDDKLPNNSTIVVHKTHTSTLQSPVPSTTEGDDKVKTTAGQQVQVRHHHHHYHHHHHHVHKQKRVDPDDGSLRNMVSNILTASAEGDAANYGSGSGSNNKSNGENGGSWQKGTSSALVVEGGKIESDNGVAKNDNGVPKKDNGVVIKCNDGDGSGSGSGRGSGVDQERLSQREAALNKFRQKRKERCFKKKVRYQSRKKLAEQRPRVRGQFVRHVTNGVNNEDADS